MEKILYFNSRPEKVEYKKIEELEKLLDSRGVPRDKIVEILQSKSKYHFILSPIRTSNFDSSGGLLCESSVIDWPQENYNQEVFIRWSSMDDLCCVDADGQYPIGQIENFIPTNPVPLMAWITHSGCGLRLVYQCDELLTAVEVAALAAYKLHKRGVFHRIELKRDTRHPNSMRDNQRCGQLITGTQYLNRSLSADNQDIELDQIEEWLALNHFTIGQRYSHDRCPIRPDKEERKNPVIVLDNGIFCHYCNSCGNGFISYSTLITNQKESVIKKLVEHGVHYEHARIILEKELHDFDHIKPYYSALLKIQHKEPMDRLFAIGRGIVRFNGFWGNLQGEPLTRELRYFISQLHACKEDKTKFTKFCNSTDLSDYGYYPISLIHGISIGQSESSRYTIKRPFTKCQSDIEEAWAKIELYFPKINRNLIYLLICAKAIQENPTSLPPMIFLTGSTGSGKSQSVNIAAAMLSDFNTEVLWSADQEKIRRAILQGKLHGSFVTMNEVVKQGSHESLEYILNLTEDSISHQLYIGHVRLGRLPVLIWSDTYLPIEIQNHAQIMRRIKHWSLHSKMDWHESTVNNGLYNIRDIRKVAAKECDTIISHCIDQYLLKYTTFDQIYEQLKQPTEYNENAEILRLQLVRFYNLVSDLPEPTEAEIKRWNKGVKIIETSIESEVLDLFNFLGSQTLYEQDWQQITGYSEPIKITIYNPHGNKQPIKFSTYRTKP